MVTKPAHIVFTKYAALLEDLGRAELPLAARGTLNQLAFETRTRIIKKEMPKQFTLRNNFEERSVQYGRSKNTFEIDKMVSSAGQVGKMRFKRGPKAMNDLRQQELGETVSPREGSKMLRTPSVSARIGKSANRAVAKRNRPGSSGQWLGMAELERRMGVKQGNMPMVTRARRMHAMMAKYSSSFPRGQLFVLPKASGRGANVFRIVRGKSMLIHSLTPGTRKLKKRPVVEPGYKTIVSTRADKIWEEQFVRRVNRAVQKKLKF